MIIRIDEVWMNTFTVVVSNDDVEHLEEITQQVRAQKRGLV